ncbi:MAG TPA: SidE phosphodiesterase domain-containing protein [Candidatus Nitrosotenuis sp.]|jgi:hypothetical protein|nr:SidE phosphodiesterase domain-containing protein [Candidatus Nitrosotenuis sp.]
MKKLIYIAATALAIFHIQSSQANDANWSNIVANDVNMFFKQKYVHAPHDRTTAMIGGKSYTVNRPNHALAHGMRQGFLASDILYGMKQLGTSGLALTTETQNFVAWINSKLAVDPGLIRKFQLVASVQRTGRGSEIGWMHDPIRYQQYKERDAKNLELLAKIYHLVGPGKLFKDNAELQLYKELLNSTGSVPTQYKTDYKYLKGIITSSHELDLRRVGGTFDKNYIVQHVQHALFGNAILGTAETNYLAKLWTRSGEYLAATGDRDSAIGKYQYSSHFYTQAHDPASMVKALHSARAGSSVQF